MNNIKMIYKNVRKIDEMYSFVLQCSQGIVELF
jgi:hypothetical protein